MCDCVKIIFLTAAFHLSSLFKSITIIISIGDFFHAHDRTVKENLNDLMGRVDVIVLAQASIARVVAQIPEKERKVPILSSLRLGVQRLKEKLESLGK